MDGITWFLLGSSLGFAAGATLFALIFRKRALWGWGFVLALCMNVPTLLMLRTIGHDLYLTIVFGAVIALGLGGFGIGAVVGMIIVIVWGSPKSSDIPKKQLPSQFRGEADPL
jgi:hypothetical protein